jgi:hypothetical protein
MIESDTVLRAGYIKRIHVDQHRIKSNARDETNLPVLTVQAAGGPYKAHEVEIRGPSRMVYDGRTLSCGAKCWLETTAEVATFVHNEEPCCEPEGRPEPTDDLPPSIHGTVEGYNRGCCCAACVLAKD